MASYDFKYKIFGSVLISTNTLWQGCAKSHVLGLFLHHIASHYSDNYACMLHLC